MAGFGYGARRGGRRRATGGSPTPTPAPTGLSRNYRVLFIGDSTTAGVGAGSGGSSDVNGGRPHSVPLQCAARLNALGYKAIAESLCAANNNGFSAAEWTGYRPEITIAGTIATSSAGPTIGGAGPRLGSGIGITFTTTEPVDVVEFAYPRASGFGTLSLSIDGGAATTYNQNVTPSDYVKQTITGLSTATHSFAFGRTAGTPHGPFFVNAWKSGEHSLQILNAGARNWTTADWIGAGGPAAPLNAIAVIAPDLVVIDLGINDWRAAGTTIAAFKANMQVLITACTNAGAQVILCVPHDIASYATATDAWNLTAAITAYQQLATTNGCSLVNASHEYFVAGLVAVDPATYAVMNAAGLMNDTLHCKAAPYQIEGYAVAGAIIAALGV
jgi:lysophospholipase L1-like esterase